MVVNCDRKLKKGTGIIKGNVTSFRYFFFLCSPLYLSVSCSLVVVGSLLFSLVTRALCLAGDSCYVRVTASGDCSRSDK